MPTNRRRRRIERRSSPESLETGTLLELLTGRGLLERYPSAEALAAGWEAHRPWLLSLWIEHLPCSRPFAWWLTEAVPKWGERWLVDPDQPPPEYRDNWRDHGILHTEAWQEPELSYLERNGLLTAAERQLVRKCGRETYVASPYHVDDPFRPFFDAMDGMVA